MKKEHIHTHTHKCKHPLPTFTQAFVFAPSLFALLRLPPPACSSRSPRSPSFLYDELLGGFSVWQEALSLIRDEKNQKERETERKEEDGEGG